MKKRFGFYLCILITVGLTACSSFENIKIGDIKQYEIQKFEDNELKVRLVIPVENPTIFPFKIESADLRTTINGRYIGKLELDTVIKVESKKNKDYQVPVNIKISNILVTAFVMMNIKEDSEIKLKLEGIATGKSLFIRKEYIIDEEFSIKL